MTTTKSKFGRRTICCSHCAWSTWLPARNALGTTAKLRGLLTAHIRERHDPTFTPALQGAARKKGKT